MFKRFLKPLTKELLSVSPAVLISGARQVGKSTLAMELFDNYILMDDITVRASAEDDPVSFIENLPKPVCIDEIQKMPQLFEVIKTCIDRRRSNGMFLLTGSASVLDMKGVGDTLAGRLIDLTMWPLSSRERTGNMVNPVEQMVDQDIAAFVPEVSSSAIVSHILTGGFPEAVKIADARLRSFWFASYISTYIERDVRDIGEIRNVANFMRLVNILAARSASILKISELAGSSGLNEATVSNYLTLLEMVFQVRRVPAFAANFSKRFIKSPKIFFLDTGILCHLLGINTREQFYRSMHKGQLVETYVLSELVKHAGVAENRSAIYHYRTNDRKEIDFILETPAGIVAIEVKASAQVDKRAFRHIMDLQKKSDEFLRGIVFYLGDKVLSFGKELYAVPLSFWA